VVEGLLSRPTKPSAQSAGWLAGWLAGGGGSAKGVVVTGVSGVRRSGRRTAQKARGQ